MSQASVKREPQEFLVGLESDFPAGQRKMVRVRNIEIGVYNVDGTLYALRNVCPHQFGPLCDGPVTGEMICSAETGWRLRWTREGEILTCPWHGLEFDLMTGTCLATDRYQVRQYQVSVKNGEVFLSMDRQAKQVLQNDNRADDQRVDAS